MLTVMQFMTYPILCTESVKETSVQEAGGTFYIIQQECTS